jgi:hypothetical protein
MLPQYTTNSEVIFLDNTSGVVKSVQGNTITLTQMINNICVMYQIEKEKKILVFCEDNEAKLWLKNLLGTKITKNIQILLDSFGSGNLVFIANKKIPVLKTSIFILDGDQNKSLRNNKCPRVLLLPGNKRPEDIFYEYLRNLPANDSFWGSTGNYTQQVCFKDLPTISHDRNVMKNWFKMQSQFWGRGCAKLFNRWKKDNSQIVIEFKKEFEKTLDYAIKIN